MITPNAEQYRPLQVAKSTAAPRLQTILQRIHKPAISTRPHLFIGSIPDGSKVKSPIVYKYISLQLTMRQPRKFPLCIRRPGTLLYVHRDLGTPAW
jgi:hypothetical protein